MLREGILFFLPRPNGMEDGVLPLLKCRSKGESLNNV